VPVCCLTDLKPRLDGCDGRLGLCELEHIVCNRGVRGVLPFVGAKAGADDRLRSW
jgi:hypothetical protein